MGKTTPPYRAMVQRTEADLRNFRRALRRERQPAYEELWRHVHNLSAAGNAVATDDPTTAMWLSICTEQQRLIDELEARVAELEHEVRDPPAFDGDPPAGQGTLPAGETADGYV